MSSFVVRARQLVHDVYAGDFIDDGGYCECPWGQPNYHSCVAPVKQFAQVFSRYRVSKSFEQNILENGIIHPLNLETHDYTHDRILCNGHHRLMVAYKYNLYVPVAFTERSHRWLADDDKRLPNSGDPDRYRDSHEVASFNNKLITA